jgi:hypothetical protein
MSTRTQQRATACDSEVFLERYGTWISRGHLPQRPWCIKDRNTKRLNVRSSAFRLGYSLVQSIRSKFLFSNAVPDSTKNDSDF